jgi:diketogulonate reductase-like aldo/keto reductase
LPFCGSFLALPQRQAVLQQLFDAGGRVIDSSPMYGSSESVSGELAESLGVGERLFWATKVWISGKDAGIAQMPGVKKPDGSIYYRAAAPVGRIIGIPTTSKNPKEAFWVASKLSLDLADLVLVLPQGRLERINCGLLLLEERPGLLGGFPRRLARSRDQHPSLVSARFCRSKSL